MYEIAPPQPIRDTRPIPNPIKTPTVGITPSDVNVASDLEPYNASYQNPSEINLPDELSHYTNSNPETWKPQVLGKVPGDEVYLTPSSELSPSSARIGLSLDKTPNFRIDFDGQSVDPEKIELIRRVTGNVFNQGGGEWEIIYHGQLDLTKAIRIVKLP